VCVCVGCVVCRQATERLEVNDRTRGECFNALKNTVQNEKLITHALVFVGTKLLVSYTRGRLVHPLMEWLWIGIERSPLLLSSQPSVGPGGRSQDIDPSDLLLLITDFHATFHPPGNKAQLSFLLLSCKASKMSQKCDSISPLSAINQFFSFYITRA